MALERTEWNSALEAILFALGEPVDGERLAQALGELPKRWRQACQTLAQDYENRGAGLRLVRLENSWQLVSAPQWGEIIQGASWPGKSRTSSLRAALETLTLVAYFQPVTRVYIDQARGVDSTHSLSLLLDRELIAPCGQLGRPRRPILYRTTPTFLRSFGLASLEELPPLPEGGGDGEEGAL